MADTTIRPVDDAPADDAPRERPPVSLVDTPRTPSLAKLERELAQLFGAVGLMVGMAGVTYGDAEGKDGMVIIDNADYLAEKYTNLAAKNPRIEKMLKGLVEGSAWGEAITATLCVAIPIAANHGAPVPPAAVAMFTRVPPAPPESPAPKRARSRS
jgi:hypothetical protein